MKRFLRAKNPTVLLLTLAAIGAVALTSVAGFIVYANMRRVLSVRDWIDHSQQILSSLQSTTQRVDRIESATRIYSLARDEDNLAAARSAGVGLQSLALDLDKLTVDNPLQSRNAGQIAVCAADLNRALAAITVPIDPLPTSQVLACRKAISLMAQEERTLLKQRDLDSRTKSFRSFVAGLAFVGLALLVVVVLFAMLVRDALRHHAVEQQIQLTNQQLATTVQSLEQRVEESRILTSARDELQLCLTAAEAYACGARSVAILIPGSLGSLWILNGSHDIVERAAAWGEPHSPVEEFPLDACCALRTGRARWRRPGISEVHCAHFAGTPHQNYVCLPLSAQGDTLGVLCVELPDSQAAALALDRSQPLHELVELIAMAVAGLQLRLRLENQSIRDSLTGLFNRHFMEAALDSELRRAARQGTSVAILMLDIDHFTQFNDTYGHQAGDQVLHYVARTMIASVRTEDLVCRYGGEEFVIILPEINVDFAILRAEALRSLVGEIRVRYHGEPLREVSLSIGLAMYPHQGETSDQVLRASDRALYQAKHRGRNQVVDSGATPLPVEQQFLS